jgi:hypothetical protein
MSTALSLTSGAVSPYLLESALIPGQSPEGGMDGARWNG